HHHPTYGETRVRLVVIGLVRADRIQRVERCEYLAGVFTLRMPVVERIRNVGTVDVPLFVVGIARVRWLTRQPEAEPVQLDFGHVPYETQQRHRRRWDRARSQLVVGEALAFPLECCAVKFEPGD